MMRGPLLAALIATGLVASTAPAHADFISIALLTFIGLETSKIAIAVTTFLITTAASVGLSYLAKALAPKPKDLSSLPGGTTGKLQTGGTVPRSFVVGEFAVAGSLAYPNTYSASAAITAAAALSKPTAASGTTPNAYLVQVIALSDIPVTAMTGLLVNGVPVTWNPGATQSFEGIPIQEYHVAGQDYLWIRFYDGTQVAADPALVHLFDTDPDRPYDDTRVFTGIAYAVVTALVNENLFHGGFPQCKFILQGAAFYDRRADTTAGGSGSQRLNDPTTWEYTKNNAVIAEAILRGISYNGQWCYGAQTVGAAQLPFDSWTAGASECDVEIDLADSGTEPQFTASGEIHFNDQPADTLDHLMRACNGRIAEIGGVYKIRVGAPGSAVFSFTDSDVLSTEQQTFTPFPSLGQTVNAVTAKYVEPSQAWNQTDAPPLYDTDLEDEDGGRRLSADVDYSFVTSGTQVQRLMKSERDMQRAFRTHALPIPFQGTVIEPLDVVSWTSTRNGYTSKLFEVITADDNPNVNVNWALREIDPNAYDWDAGTDEQPVSEGTISIINPPPQAMAGWQVFPATIIGDDGAARPSIEVQYAGDEHDVVAVNVQVRLASSGAVVFDGEQPYGDIDSVPKSVVLNGTFLPLTAYQARGKFIPGSSRTTDWSSWLDVTTDDIRFGPDDVRGPLWNLINSKIEATEQAVDDVRDIFAAVSERVAAMALDSAERKGNIQVVRDEMRVADGDNAASIVSLQEVMVSADEALAADIETLTADFGDASAAISAEMIARASGDSALAGEIDTFTASLGDVQAEVDAEEIARADADDALAADILAVSASITDTTADGHFRLVASAGPGGALTYVDMEVRASVLDTFAEAGFRLAAGVDGATSFSLIQQKAQQHLVGFDDDSLVPPWESGTVNGSGRVTLSSLMLADRYLNDTRFFDTGVLKEYLDVDVSGLTITDSANTFMNGGAGLALFDEHITTQPGDRIVAHYQQIIQPNAPFPVGVNFIALFINGTLADKQTSVALTMQNPYPLESGALDGGDTRVEVRFGWDSISSNGTTVIGCQPVKLKVEIEHKAKSTAVTGAIPTPAISYLNSFDVAADTLSVTGESIGAADEYRNVVISIGWHANSLLAPVLTIDGVSMTLAGYRFFTQFGTNVGVATYRLRVPTGTTADININVPGADVISAAMWRVISFRDAQIHSTACESTDTNVLSFPFARAGEVFNFFAFGWRSDGVHTNTNFTPGWSGSETITEDDDANDTAANFKHGAYHLTATAAASRFMSIVTDGGTNNPFFMIIGEGWQ